MKSFAKSLLLCCFFFVSLHLSATAQVYAIEGAPCDSQSGPNYICVASHLRGSRKYSPRQQYETASVTKLAIDGCSSNEVCVEKVGRVGKIGGLCKDVNAILKSSPNNANALNGMVGDNTSCFLGVICPLKLLTSIPVAMQDKIGKMTGLDDPDVQMALMCEEGIPSTFDPTTNKVVVGSTCTCVDSSPLVSSGITLLCTRYTSGIKESSLSASSVSSKGTMSDGWFARILKDTAHFSAIGHSVNTVGDIVGAATASQNPSKDAEQNILKTLQEEYKKLPTDSFDAVAVENLNQRAAYFASCINCARRGGYYSGIGCIPMQSVGSFITGLLYQIGIGLAGAFTVLCSIYSAFRMQTSMGDAEGLANSRKTLMACLSGLVLVIFAIFIVRFIGADILRVPGIN